MFVDAYGAAVVIALASVVLGQAICLVCGGIARWWAAPGVGLASLIVLEGAAIKLPGRAVTAAVLGLLLVATATAVVFRRTRLWDARRDLVVIAGPLLAASLPFIASGRIGLLGVSLDNDTAQHLLWAEALRSARMAALWGTGSGYPLGPHSLVAVVGTLLGEPLDSTLTGLLLAVVPITALVAAGLLRDQTPWRRVLIALPCSMPYLVAAYYAEGAVKETIMAALLLAFVVHLDQIAPRWDRATVFMRWRLLVPALVLAGGAVYAYSYVGLAWFAVTVAIWAAAAGITRPELVRAWISRGRLSAGARWVVGAIAFEALLILPVAGQTLSFYRTVGLSASGTGAIPTGILGNLVGRLSPYEMFGIWTSGDFRRLSTNVFYAGELAAFALAIAIYGTLWSLRRGKLLLPAAVAACTLIWWRADHTQSPYVSAKALVIAAPVISGVGLQALLTPPSAGAWRRLVQLALAGLFAGLSAYSSYQVLRNEPVQAPEASRELARIHRTIGNSPVLFLGDDDFAPWELRPAAVASLSANSRSVGHVASRPGKPWVYGEALDFDSVDPSGLDNFRYVITSNTPYASQPPSNFQLITTTGLYELWRRTGITDPRSVIEPSGAPGAILDCQTPLGRRLEHAHGVASVMARPVLVPGLGLSAGSTATFSLPLPPGSWKISLQYYGDFDLTVTSEGRRWAMPAYLGRPGPYLGVGSVVGRGTGSPVPLTIKASDPSSLTGTGDLLFVSISSIAATHIPADRKIIPLSRACGRYVDWYRVG
jgi:hypothetical protein